MAMIYKEVTVTAREGPDAGRQVRARVAICEGCGCDVFVVFLIGNQTHRHFQCGQCDETYCENPAECELPGTN